MTNSGQHTRITGETLEKISLVFGILLLLFGLSGMYTQVTSVHWLAGILGFLLFTTFLVQRFVKGTKSWYLFSMVETDRFNPIFDKLKNARWIEWIAEAGTVLGFGAVAVDFLWGRKLKQTWQRVALFIISIIILGGLFEVFLGGNVANNPLAKGPGILYDFFFGLFGFAGFLLIGLLFQGIDNIEKMLVGKQACAGIAPVIPGVQTPNVPIFVPIEAWISLVAILIIHEASHGFLARRHKLQVHSSGLLLAGLIPIGAFVKPDEEKMQQMDKRKQIQILAAGPTSNFVSFLVVGVIAVLLLQGIVNPVLGPRIEAEQANRYIGVNIIGVDENITLCGDTFPSPAFGQIDANTQLLAVNDQNVSNISSALMALRENPQEPKKLLLQKDGTVFEKTLVPNALGRLGIQVEAIPNPDYHPSEKFQLFLQVFGIISNIVLWFVILSLLVTIGNFIPANPFDGGKMAQYMVAPYFGFLQMSEEDTERFVGRLFIWILIPLIIANALPIIL